MKLNSLLFLLLATLPLGCGKSKKSSGPSSTEQVASSGSLAVTYPEGMSVGSTSTTAPTSSANDPTTVAYASGGLALPASTTLSLADEAYDPDKIPPRERILAAAKRLKGEADDCLPAQLFNLAPKPELACYSPDGDLVKVVGKFPNASGTTPTGEACLAAYSRAKIAEVSQIVDQAQSLVEGMICAAYKANKYQHLPKPGETLDLAETFTEIIGAKKVDPNSDLSSATGAPPPVEGVAPPKDLFRIAQASIKRLENTADRAQFLSQIVMEVNGTVRQIRLMHMPSLTSGNNDYIGRLSIKTVKVQRTGIAENRQNYLDINYMLDLDPDDGRKPKTRYRLLRAMFDHANLEKMKKDPFAGIGQLDLNVGARFEPDFTADNPMYGSFPSDILGNPNVTPEIRGDLNTTLTQVNRIDYAGNPITNEGMFAFWINPGGNYSEAARGMIASRRRESPDSTRLVGCAISGAALKPDITGNYSIRKAQRENILLKPTGYFHPGGIDDNANGRVNPTCRAGNCQMAPFAYLQCYRQDDQGLFKPDLSKTVDKTAQFDVINTKERATDIENLMPVVDGKIQAPK